MSDFKRIFKLLSDLDRFVNQEIYDIIGVEAVNHFQDNFRKEGFEKDKWDPVKRKKSSSGWYGFKYGANSRKPGKGNSKGTSNFSPAATKRPILTGTGELMRSIRYRNEKGKRKVVVLSDRPYAKIHNEGGEVKVFGKHRAAMPQRQFMAPSRQLTNKIQRKADRRLQAIINKNR